MDKRGIYLENVHTQVVQQLSESALESVLTLNRVVILIQTYIQLTVTAEDLITAEVGQALMEQLNKMSQDNKLLKNV